MSNRKLKRLMTDLAKGKISQEQVDMQLEVEKVAPEAPKDETEGKEIAPDFIGDDPKKMEIGTITPRQKTHKRLTKVLKDKEKLK